MFDYLTFDIFLTEGMGYKEYGQWGTGVWGLWAMGHKGYGPHRQWVTWAMGYRGMGHMGNEAHWGIGYRGMGHMGNRGTWGMGYKGYGPHGERGPMGNLLPKYQKDVKLSKRCQVVKKMSNVKIQTPKLWRRFTKKLN